MIDLKNLSYEEEAAIEEHKSIVRRFINYVVKKYNWPTSSSSFTSFRKRVEKEIDDPMLLEDETLYYRFLKARDFNIEKAEKMLRNHIIWRKAKQVTKIREEFVPKEVFVKYIQPSTIGLDKKGNSIEYSPTGKLDGKETWKCFKINNYLDHWIWYAERNLYSMVIEHKEQAKAAKTYPIKALIFDLDELTFSNATSKISTEILLGIVHILSDNYPETLSYIYIINAPRYYVIIFSILKAVMSNAMLQKISVFPKDGWKEALLKSIDADVLPAFLGGNRTDPDGNPLCKTFVSHDPIPSERHLLPEEDRYFKDKTEIQTLFVPKSSRKEVDVEVTEEGSVIHWEFFVRNKDIGIGLFRKDVELMEILPVVRYYTVDGTTQMSYKTKAPGKYILMFDNSFSWMKSKEVEYIVKVVTPREN